MRPSDDLFMLIKALRPTEKRYFTLFARRQVIGEKNNYQRLFDAINARDDYDEAAIKAIFAEEKLAENFAFEKKKLYDMVLRCMREYHSEKGARTQLKELIKNIAFLADKGLYNQSDKLLRKAIDIARRHEFLAEWLHLLDLERARIQEREPANVSAKLEAAIRETNTVLAKLSNYYFYHDLYERLFARVRPFLMNGNKVAATELEAEMQQPQMQRENAALSFDARVKFNVIHTVYCRLAGKLDTALQHYARILELLEDAPFRIAEAPQAYMKALSNHAGLCIRLGEITEFRHTLAKFDTVPVRTPDDEMIKFINVAHLTLLHAMNTGDLEGALAYVPAIEQGLERYNGKIIVSRELSFYYNLAILHFLSEDFAGALQYVNRILEHRRVETREDLLVFAFLLLPVIHYEMGNGEILSSISRSSTRFIRQKQSQFDFEKSLLRFLRKLPDLVNAGERREAFAEQLDMVRTMLNDPAEQRVLGLRELSFWLESRLHGRSISAIFRDSLSAQPASV